MRVEMRLEEYFTDLQVGSVSRSLFRFLITRRSRSPGFETPGETETEKKSKLLMSHFKWMLQTEL